MIIGIITMWGCQDFAPLAIKQAIKYCDEIFVCVNAHSKNLLKFEDNTLEIAKSFDINIVNFNSQATHLEIKSKILNLCLSKSKYFDIGNWVWILDSDEYYSTEHYTALKDLINSSIFNQTFDQICVSEKYFYINMQHYLKAEHNRLFRINSLTDKFYPMQRWPSKKCFKFNVLDMFHYCMLINPYMKIEQWKTEYPNTNQQNKIDWITKIYKNYDLNNEEYWIKENEKLFGIKSPLLNSSAISDNGRLYKYEGSHPKLIEEKGFTKIEDFRKRWEFT